MVGGALVEVPCPHLVQVLFITKLLLPAFEMFSSAHPPGHGPLGSAGGIVMRVLVLAVVVLVALAVGNGGTVR